VEANQFAIKCGINSTSLLIGVTGIEKYKKYKHPISTIPPSKERD